jgi:nucleoside-diphosphate-sugar epimerase
MRVFIVGATGVLGRPVVRSLLASGDRVVALVRSLERAKPIALPGVELYEGDLLQQTPGQFASLLAGCDAAAHLATALRPGSPGLGTTNTNVALRVDGTRALLDSVRAVGVGRYVQQSIALSYVDRGDDWVDESTPFYRAPDSEGAPAHEVMEEMVRGLDSSRTEWVILRGGAFVGPDTFQERTIAGLRAGTERVPGDGQNWVSCVHVDDYADAVVAALHSSLREGIFNITDEPIRNGDYLDGLAERLGLPAAPRNPDLPRPRSYRCSSAGARDALGWTPTRGIWPLAGA